MIWECGFRWFDDIYIYGRTYKEIGWSIAHAVVASQSEKVAMLFVPQSTTIISDPLPVSIAQV